MKTSATVLIAGLFAAGISHAQDKLIYKSVAADGSVVFTDKAAPNAIVITPAPLNIMDSATPKADVADAPEQTDPDRVTVSKVTIVSPVDQITLIDPDGPVFVDIEIFPASTLPPGYSAEIRLNGRLVVSGWSTSLPMDVPERGSHTLQASIVDDEGGLLVESDEIQIHVKQTVVTGAEANQ